MFEAMCVFFVVSQQPDGVIHAHFNPQFFIGNLKFEISNLRFPVTAFAPRFPSL
jgi:hypothetical protein